MSRCLLSGLTTCFAHLRNRGNFYRRIISLIAGTGIRCGSVRVRGSGYIDAGFLVSAVLMMSGPVVFTVLDMVRGVGVTFNASVFPMQTGDVLFRVVAARARSKRGQKRAHTNEKSNRKNN